MGRGGAGIDYGRGYPRQVLGERFDVKHPPRVPSDALVGSPNRDQVFAGRVFAPARRSASVLNNSSWARPAIVAWWCEIKLSVERLHHGLLQSTSIPAASASLHGTGN